VVRRIGLGTRKSCEEKRKEEEKTRENNLRLFVTKNHFVYE